MAIELNEIDGSPPLPARRVGRRFRLPVWRPAVAPHQLRFFTEQLSLMLETGANLHQALQLLHDQTQHPAMVSVIESLRDEVAGGRAFSEALARHPNVFSTTYVNLVAASENGGFMHEVLNELVKMEDRADELRATVRSALSYPVFLSLFSIAVIVFVLVVVFPKFGTMFAKIHDQLPVTTIALMATSDFLRHYWIHLSTVLVAVIVLAYRWCISPAGRTVLDRLKLNLPGLRTVLMQIYMTQSLRVMGLSLANGVNVVDTLAATRDIVANGVIRRFFVTVQEHVLAGNGIAAGFRLSPLIPPLVQSMIATGEESGNLPKVMSRLAEYYERELTKRLKTLSRMAEPVMLLVMGVVVGVIVSSLILPIFKLSRAVG